MKRLFVFILTLTLLCTMILPIAVDALAPPVYGCPTYQLPDWVDYGGTTWNLLVWNRGKETVFSERTETTDAEDIGNDVFLRQKMLEDLFEIQLNVTFMESCMGEADGYALYSEVLLGKNAYEAICADSLCVAKLAAECVLMDLNQFDYPYTSAPWYPMDYQEWEIGGRLFFVENNSSINNILASWVVYANNVMIEDKGLEDIEDVVLWGNWTLSKMKDYSRNWVTEAQGNADKSEAERVYGLTISNRTCIDAFYHAAGFDSFRMNDKGEPEFAYFDEDDVSKISGFVDTFLDICNSPEFGYGDRGAYGVDWTDPLTNRNAAFYVGLLSEYKRIDEQGTYSVIPLPKLDEAQEKYYTLQSTDIDTWCVPSNAEDPDLGGLLIEAVSYTDYTDISYKFFDSDFKYRYSSSEKGVKIFELIRNSTICDFGRTWLVGTPYVALRDCLSTGTDQFQLQNTFADSIRREYLTQQNALKNFKKLMDDFVQEYPSHQHDWEYDTTTQEATHTQEGIRRYICRGCKDVKYKTVAKLTKHTYSTYEPYDENQHKRVCACGEFKLADHSYGEDGEVCVHCRYGEVVTPPVDENDRDQTPPQEEKTDESDGGCGSVVSSGLGMLLLLVGAGMLVKRKEHF